MSPRYLKTKFPCVHCGAPADVERLREEPFATCDACTERNAAKQRAGLFLRSANDRAALANKEEGVELIEGWMFALAKGLEGAGCLLKALRHLTPAERRLFVRNAMSWADWVKRRLGDLEERFADAHNDESSGFALIDGGGELPEVAATPSIRLMTRGEP